ncbi:hypothetical protein BDW62DRAFT_201931 [Aspergillus aurantiobrunneus]
MLAALILAFAGSILPLVDALPSNPHAQSKRRFDWDSTRHLIAFGDSYTFVQGTHGYPNYSFIGDQLNLAYDAQTLLTDKIVQNQTGTSAGGPNWVEFLTGCGLKEGLTSPLSCTKQLWDFAFAGSGVSAEHIPLHHPFTVSLVNQITQFTTYGHPVLTSPTSSKAGKEPILHPPSTLIAIWIGINDINDSADYNLTTSFTSFYNTLLTTLFSSLTDLTALGYTNYVLLNLPPLDWTPSNQARLLAGESPSPNTTQVGWFNSALERHAARFAERNPGSNVLVFDAHEVLSAVLDFPAEYGIVNTTDFCPGSKQPDVGSHHEAYGCPTPLETYFWYDSGHITSKVHGVLARALEGTLRKWKGD